MLKKSHNKQDAVLQFIHMTDTHLLNQPDETFYNLNTKQCFESVLSHSKTHYPDIDFLVVTGDISQTGTKESYALFKSITQQYESPIYCIPGNHDTPKLLQHEFPDSPTESIKIIQLGKFSLILLSSLVENKHHGIISQNCLQQLGTYLKHNANQFKILAIHPPPVPINSAWLDVIGLKNKTEFLQIINKFKEYSLLLFGHAHQAFDTKEDKLRVLGTPSTCYQFKANSAVMQRVKSSRPAYRYIKLTSSNIIDTKVHYIK